MSTGSRLIGFAARVAAACFRAARSTPSVRPSAVRVTARLHPSKFVSPLQSSFVLMLCPCPFGSGHLPGFVPSSRQHRGASTDREASQASLRSVHRLSQPLDGLLRAPAPGLVSSPSRVQGASRSGASLSAQRRPARRRQLPPRRCRDGRSTDLAGHAVHSHLASATRLRSARSRVLDSPVISRSVGRSPLRVRSSSRLSTPLAPKLVTHLRPLMAFPPPAFACAIAGVERLQRAGTEGPGESVSRPAGLPELV